MFMLHIQYSTFHFWSAASFEFFYRIYIFPKWWIPENTIFFLDFVLPKISTTSFKVYSVIYIRESLLINGTDDHRTAHLINDNECFNMLSHCSLLLSIRLSLDFRIFNLLHIKCSALIPCNLLDKTTLGWFTSLFVLVFISF